VRMQTIALAQNSEARIQNTGVAEGLASPRQRGSCVFSVVLPLPQVPFRSFYYPQVPPKKRDSIIIHSVHFTIRFVQREGGKLVICDWLVIGYLERAVEPGK